MSKDRACSDTGPQQRYDKEGHPHRGRRSPGRCHVCLAWTRYPYSEGSLTVCPDCKDLDETKREYLRERVSEALEPVWANPFVEVPADG